VHRDKYDFFCVPVPAKKIYASSRVALSKHALCISWPGAETASMVLIENTRDFLYLYMSSELLLIG